MSQKRYTEKELIYPALYFINKYDAEMNMSNLIDTLSQNLDISDEDREILFGRNDTRFSQKVRNLISHGTLTPYFEYVDDKRYKINSLGIDYLSNPNNRQIEFLEDEDDDSPFEVVSDFPEYKKFIYEFDVRVNLVNQTVYELHRRFKIAESEQRGGLILDESFQRNSVWSRRQKSQLIESILIGIPLPLFYLAEDKKSNLIVVDGRQRLTAIFEFLDGKYKLSNLQMLYDLNGKGVNDFKGDLETLKARIEDSFLYVARIDRNTPEVIKLQLFSRVNRNGTPLNAQEVRHALHQGSITELLMNISKRINLKVSTSRMKDRQFILRALSLLLFYKNELINYETASRVEYKTIDEFLGESMDAINTFNEDQLRECEIEFINSFNKAMSALGGSAFRLAKGKPVNMILFEITILISWLNIEQDDIVIVEFLNDFKSYKYSENQETIFSWFENNIKFHRDSKENFSERLNVVNLLREKYNDQKTEN